LKLEITIQNILESESNKENETDKFNRVDVFAITTGGELIIIELQVNNEVDYFRTPDKHLRFNILDIIVIWCVL
jgi:hypothetical protein